MPELTAKPGSAAVELTGAGTTRATLDRSDAGAQTIRNLTAVVGTTVALRAPR